MQKWKWDCNRVGEFPELQSTMGYYYVKEDNKFENKARIAHAMRDHYRPRFAGHEVNIYAISAAVALAVKIDTLIGISGINEKPTGESDPFWFTSRCITGCLNYRKLENNYNSALKEKLIIAA